MKKLISLSTFILLAFVTKPAHAIVYFEPYAGFQSGSSSIETTPSLNGTKLPSTKTDENESGGTYGAKAGFSFLMLAFGAEYMHENMNSGFGMESVGGFARVGLGILGVHAAYFPASVMKDSTTTIKGTTTKVGVGFSFLPFIALNIDYIQSKANSIDVSGLASGVSVDVDGTSSRTMVSLSVPINL
jgi:hypothetical protein